MVNVIKNSYFMMLLKGFGENDMFYCRIKDWNMGEKNWNFFEERCGWFVFKYFIIL